jgi:hypothetical protein
MGCIPDAMAYPSSLYDKLIISIYMDKIPPFPSLKVVAIQLEIL